MTKEIIQKLNELAERIKFGSVTVEYTFNRGKIVKAIVKETQEVILFSNKQ